MAILYPPVLKNNDIQNRESCPQDKKKKSDLHEDCPSLVQMVEWLEFSLLFKFPHYDMISVTSWMNKWKLRRQRCEVIHNFVLIFLFS